MRIQNAERFFEMQQRYSARRLKNPMHLKTKSEFRKQKIKSVFNNHITFFYKEPLPPKESRITGVAKSIKSKAKTFWSGS